jgi:hypothetical protein
MILSSEISDLLNEAEVRFPVDQWDIAGVHAWPLLRIRYGFGMLAKHGYRTTVKNGNGSRAVDVLGGPARRLVARLQDHTQNASLSAPAEVVLLSDGISYAEIGGSWMEKFCDPLITKLEQRHLRCLLLSPLHSYRVPRYTPSYFVQPELDRAAIRSFSASVPSGRLPEIDSFAAWAAARGKPGPSADWLRRACARIRHMADFFRGVLERGGSTLGVVVNYYSPTGMAFVLACRECGLPVVDIQHGVSGDLHFAYGRWARVPARGFNLLPTHFWCWDEADAAAIEAWALAAGHRALVGGNPWLAYWANNSSSVVRAYEELIAAIRNRAPKAIHALLTLQFPSQSEQTRDLLLTVQRAGPEIFWWIRLHPSLLAERSRIAMMIGGAEHVEVNAATAIPLPALLHHVDVHITYSSSTVLEAATMGVPSVITSTYGAEQYPRQILDGTAVQVHPHSLQEAVAAQARRKGSWTAAAPADGSSAIEELLHAAGLAAASELALAR